jgi:hypothetical protein
VSTWRLTVHHRDYTAGATPRQTGIAELVEVRSVKLETKWNASATLTWTMDGRDPSCAYVAELSTDVLLWRDGALMGRFIVAQSEDQVTAQDYSVNFTAHDYLSMLGRRILTSPNDLVYSQWDQDDIVTNLLWLAINLGAGGGTSFVPGSSLPIVTALVNPDGTTRAKSGVLRDRTYTGGSVIGDLIANLAAVIGGFDFDVQPSTTGADRLRVFYGAQGVTRGDFVCHYGSTVAGFTRSANSTDFANYQRVIGQGDSTVGAPQLYSEAWGPDANNVTTAPWGLWENGSNESDVSDPNTLSQKAHGDLALSSLLSPSYSLTMSPGAVVPGTPNMGDTVGLVLQVGRLSVSTTVRVLGITWDVGDDFSGEDVTLTVGRPAVSLSAMFQAIGQDVNALARR